MQPAACRASPQGAPLTRARPVFLPFPAFPHPFSAFLRAFSALPPHPFQHLPKFLARPFRISRIFSSHFSRSFSALSPHYFSVFSRHFQIPSAPFPYPFRISPAPFPRFPAPLRLPQPGPHALFSAPVLLAPKPIKPCDRAVFRGAKFAPEKRAKRKGGAPEQSAFGPSLAASFRAGGFSGRCKKTRETAKTACVSNTEIHSGHFPASVSGVCRRYSNKRGQDAAQMRPKCCARE